jgi:hypothetical protein
MSSDMIIDTVTALLGNDKGLLAMDESNPTCNKRFAKLGIPQTVEARRAYRELIVTTPGLGECISGAILYDETIRQQKKDGTPFIQVLNDAGIIPGIKVDGGAKDLAGHPGEKITEGLDGLRDRLKEYFQMGARFAKWRAVITPGTDIPSRGCIARQCLRIGALCCVVPGSRHGSHCRAGSADGRRAYAVAMFRHNGGSAQNGVPASAHAGSNAGRHDTEAQHGACRVGQPRAGNGGRSG